jgi:primosomal protein N'
MSFIKSIYSPTIYTYKKESPENWLEIDLSKQLKSDEEEEVIVPIKEDKKVKEFINSLPSIGREKEETREETIEIKEKTLKPKEEIEEKTEESLKPKEEIEEKTEEKSQNPSQPAAVSPLDKGGVKKDETKMTYDKLFGNDSTT